MRDIVPRPEYLRRLAEHRDVDLVKIITGLRRCGKSTLLDLYHAYLLGEGVAEEQIIHLNLESLKYREIKDYLTLYDYISPRIAATGKTYLIFDEIQAVTQWERAIESFRLDYDVDIYLTGSNAYMLSTELATLLSGRYVEIQMLPLSFKEFLAFHSFPEAETMDSRFEKYLQFGGMPVLKQYSFHEARSNEALEGIYSTVILKDVLQRSSWASQVTLEKLVRFICGNIGSLSSPNRIGNVLTTEGDIKGQRNGKAIASHAVSRYIKALQDAFIVYSANRYDIRGKQHLKTQSKIYLADMGFRNMLLGYRDGDRGHILENIVYLELLRRDYRVSVGKLYETEVDFVAEKPQDKLYIQVTESMLSPEVRERELRPLLSIRDNYEKVVLSLDRSFLQSVEGIKVMNLIDWLLLT